MGGNYYGRVPSKYYACSASLIPKRYVVCSMVFLGLALSYIYRFSLGLLITEMVVKHPFQERGVIDQYGYCPLEKAVSSNSSSGSNYQHKGEFSWDEYTQGIILSSFFWGYILTQVPGGMIAERVGGKYTLALSVLMSAVGSLVTPVVARWGGAWGLVAVRVVSGLGQGFLFPSINELLSKWAPIDERARMGSFVFAGAYVGNVVSMSLSGLVLRWSDGDWAVVFNLNGGSGLVWLLVWLWLGYSRPEDHPGLSTSEREHLEQYAETVNMKKKLPPTPWPAMLTSLPLWAAVVGMIGGNWGLFTMLSDLPKYMITVLHFSTTQAGLWSAMLYVSMCVGAWVSAMAVDCILAKDIMSVTITRKIFTTIGLSGPGVCVLLASYSNCDQALFLIFMVLGMGLMAFECASLKLSTLDLSPNYAGSSMAMVNGLAAIAGIVSPYIVGLIITDNTMQQWRNVFLITAAVLFLTNLFFVVAGSGKIQPWNDPPSTEGEKMTAKKSSASSISCVETL